MSAAERIATAYFVYLVAVAIGRGAGARRRAVIQASLGCVLLILALARTATSPAWLIARDWLSLLYLFIGYRLPALIVVRPDRAFQRALAIFDRRWLAGDRLAALGERAPRAVVEWLELNYLFCYPLLPIGLAWLQIDGPPGAASRYTAAVLLAALPCYGLLPWLPSRPPRVLAPEGAALGRSTVRRLNRGVLNRASVQLNTFPSGHVASATAAAIVAGQSLPVAGVVLGVIAAGITLGSVIGRYHYVSDALAGLLLALAAVAAAS
jgi:membrane-associated phospholipid phosphatase